jgi:MFS family permease
MPADTLGGPFDPLPGDRRGLTGVQWLICVIAAIGFAFDTYELLMAPLIMRPALMELGGLRPGTPEFSRWVGLMFYVPAVGGGIFGLLGGYLTDRLGRRRVLTWSILLYAFSAFAAGFSTSLVMLLVLRCTTYIGVCVEFVAAVAWLAELFRDPVQRERVLGYTQAFSSLGGVMVAWANSIALKSGGSFPAINLPGWLHLGAELGSHDPHAAWRYTLMSGLIPAIPLILIRPFLPESPVWREKKMAGTLRRPSIAELFSPALRRTTIVTTVMFACSLGAAFGAIQQMPQIVPAVPEVQQQVRGAMAATTPNRGGGPESSPEAGPATALATSTTAPTTAPAVPGAVPGAVASGPRAGPAAPNPAAGRIIQERAADVTKLQEYGGLLGRVMLALLVVRIVSRRALIRLFQVPGLFIIPFTFAYAATHSLDMLKVSMFLAGLVTVAQLSFWGNYLPRVYPVHLRGTGESFAANIGGRMIGTSFAWVTATIAASLTPSNPTPVTAAQYWSYTAAAVGFAVFLIGFLFSFLLPEPPEQDDFELSAGAGGLPVSERRK